MWPFTGRKQDEPLDPSIQDRLADLERRIDRIDVEWSEWYDKFRRLYARLAKRVHDDEAREKGDSRPSNGQLGVPKLDRPMNPLAAELLRRTHGP